MLRTSFKIIRYKYALYHSTSYRPVHPFPATARICRSRPRGARDLWKRAPDCGCGDLNWLSCLWPANVGLTRRE